MRLMLSDVRDALEGLWWVLVQERRFFEAFFYVRNGVGLRRWDLEGGEGVAFAEGMITAVEWPPDVPFATS